MNGKKMISYSSGIKYVKTPEGVESEAFQARSKNGETEMLLKTKDNKLLLIQSEKTYRRTPEGQVPWAAVAIAPCLIIGTIQCQLRNAWALDVEI